MNNKNNLVKQLRQSAELARGSHSYSVQGLGTLHVHGFRLNNYWAVEALAMLLREHILSQPKVGISLFRGKVYSVRYEFKLGTYTVALDIGASEIVAA